MINELLVVKYQVQSPLVQGKVYKLVEINELGMVFQEVTYSEYSFETKTGIHVLGNVKIDYDKHTLVNFRGQEVSLTKQEWKLFDLFSSKPQHIFPYASLLTYAWGPEFRDDNQYLRVWVSRLRDKLEGRIRKTGQADFRRLYKKTESSIWVSHNYGYGFDHEFVIKEG